MPRCTVTERSRPRPPDRPASARLPPAGSRRHRGGRRRCRALFCWPSSPRTRPPPRPLPTETPQAISAPPPPPTPALHSPRSTPSAPLPAPPAARAPRQREREPVTTRGSRARPQGPARLPAPSREELDRTARAEPGPKLKGAAARHTGTGTRAGETRGEQQEPVPLGRDPGTSRARRRGAPDLLFRHQD